MDFFDLHCDTIMRCIRRNEEFSTATGRVCASDGEAFGRWAQVFAFFIPDGCEAPQAVLDEALEWYRARATEFSSVCRPLLALENGAAIGSIERLKRLARLGFRLVTLTWNGENDLGFGADCDPNSGLKPFGKSVLEELFFLDMFPDVSHLNQAGFWDVISFWNNLENNDSNMRKKVSVVATHSNCAAVAPHRRNLEDAQLRAIFQGGGLVGLNFHEDFLGKSGDIFSLISHIEHILALGGAKHVAIGSDFDGAKIHPTLAGPRKMGYLYEKLLQSGFGEEFLEDFFWGNAFRLFF